MRLEAKPTPKQVPYITTFVGRQYELAELRSALGNALGGRGHFFLISGEPGIGKTTIAEKISEEASARGFRVLWGRCWDAAGAPTYLPFVQVIRACLEGLTSEQRLSLLGGESSHQVARDLAHLLPELRQMLVPNRHPASAEPSHDPNAQRFRLFESIVAVLRHAASQRPLLVIVDDLHAADPSSLALLRFSARELVAAPVLIVATYRDNEMRSSPELARLISELAREGTALKLTGLDREQVRDMLVGRRGDAGRRQQFVDELHRITGGNPLFIDSIIRVVDVGKRIDAEQLHLGDFPIPEDIHYVLMRRVAAISPLARAMLETASVIGEEFELDCLTHANRIAPATCLDLLDECIRAGLIRDAAVAPRSFRFGHALIRMSIHEGLAIGARAELHRRVGEAIEARYQPNLQAHVAELAHHFRNSAVLGTTEKAIKYSIRAGDAAYAVFGYEDAVANWKAALALMGDHGGDPEQRARLFRYVGAVMLYMTARDPASSVDYLNRAIALYEEMGRTEDAAGVHLILGSPRPGVRAVDPALSAEHLRKARAALAAGSERPSSVSLHISLTDAAVHALRMADAIAVSDRALRMAEKLNDTRLSIRAANSRFFALFYAGRLGESFALGWRAHEAAQASNDVESGFSAAFTIGINLFLLYDIREAHRWLSRELAKPHLRQAPALTRLMLRRMVAVNALRGDLSGARQIMAETGSHENFAAHLASCEGNWESAADMLVRSQEESREGGFGVWLCAADPGFGHCASSARAPHSCPLGRWTLDGFPATFLSTIR